MKKYIQPTMIAVSMLHQCQILSGSETVHNVTGNANVGFGGSGTTSARVKDCNVWDEEW